MKRNSFICLVVFDFILVYSWIQQSNGDCEAPNLSDESLVTVTPDQGVYSNWSYIILSCQYGYTEGGSHYSYCYPLTGWNPEPALFYCYAGCTAPDLPSNTIQYPDGSSYSATQDSYMHNDVIVYACAEGSDGPLVGPDQATCIDGAWEPSLLPYCTDYTTDSPRNETSTSSPTPSVLTSNAATSSEKSYSTEPKQTTIISSIFTQTVNLNTDPEDSSTQFNTETPYVATGSSRMNTGVLDVTDLYPSTTDVPFHVPTTEAEDVFSSSAVPTSLISMTTSVTETMPYLDYATEDGAITTPMTGLFTSDEYSTLTTSSNRPSTETESLTTELFTMSSTPRSDPELTTDSDNLDRTEIFTDHADLTTDPQFTSYTDNFDRTETVTDFTSANLVTEMLTKTDAVTTIDGISTESITASTKNTNTDVTELVSKPDTIQTTDELFSSYTLETTQMFDITQELSSVTSATVAEETETRTTFQMATEENVMTTLIQQSLPPTTETDQEYITTVDYTSTDTTLLFGTETKTSSPFATTNEVESSTEGNLTDCTDVSSSNSPIPTNEYPFATEMITFPHTTSGYQDASNDTPTSTDAGDVLTSIMSITTEDFPTTNLDTTNGTESIFSTDFTLDFTQNTITNKQTDFVQTSATFTMDATSGATDLDGTTLPDAYTSIATSTMNTEGVANTDSPVSDMSTDSATMSTSLVSTTNEQATLESIATYRSGTTNQMPTLTTGGETTAKKTTPLPENTSQSYLTTFQETTIPVKATTVKPTEPRKTDPERTTQYPTSGLTASTLAAEGPTTTATTISPQETTTQSELTSRKTTIPGKATTVKPTEPKKTEPAKTTQHQTSDPLTSVSDTSSFLMVYEILEVDGNEANFTDVLTDPQSDLYQELVAQVCAVAVVVYGDLEGYTGCNVYNFTSGSIIAWFYTEFKASAEVTETTLLNTTLIKLENGNGSLEANGTVFTIDKNTIAITEVNVLTTTAQTSKSVDVTTAIPKEADDKWKIVAYSMIGAVGFLLIVVLFLVCCGDRITKSCRTNDKLVVSVNGNPVRMSDGVVAEEGISPWQTYKSHTFAFFPGAWASSEDGQNHPHEVEMEDRTTLEGEVHDVGDDFDDDYTDDEDTVFDDTRFPPPPPTMMTSANDNDDVALHLPPENVDEELGIDNVTYNVMSH